MKKDWQAPTLEVLDVSLTMKGPGGPGNGGGGGSKPGHGGGKPGHGGHHGGGKPPQES